MGSTSESGGAWGVAAVPSGLQHAGAGGVQSLANLGKTLSGVYVEIMR